MKASPEVQATLLELAELDAKRARLQHTANHLPERASLAALERERTARRADVVRLTGVVEDSEAELRRTAADVETVEARIARDRERMASSSNAKDVQGLEHELATLERRRGDLEDVELEIMERLDRERGELAAATAERDRVEREASELAGLAEQAIAHLREEAKATATARARVVAGLPAELLAKYEEVRARRGVGAAELVGGTTMATGVALDHADLQRIAAAAPDEVILCPDSGAILVRTARSRS